MRGAGRLGSRSFKPPRPQDGGKSYDPFELLPFFGDLPVAPILTPINDNFSWSVDADPADPRDCSRYPSSPYCGELPFSPGQPFHYRPEIRSNGCETCIYVYPVILWLMATPQVICYRDPNCDREEPPFDPIERDKPPRYNENVQPDRYKSPQCADRESVINIHHNWVNSFPIGTGSPPDSYGEEVRVMGTANGPKDIFTLPYGLSFYREFSVGEGTSTRRARAAGGDTYIRWEITIFYNRYINNVLVGQFTFGRVRIAWIPAPCPNMPSPPIVKPPPPSGDDDDRDDRKRREREKKRGKKMCCNVCSDAADNTAVLLREIKAIKKALGTGAFEKAANAAVGIGDGSVTAIVNLIAKRLGTNRYPVEVPQSLLTGVKGGDDILKVQSLTDYMYWLTNQLDALIGEFPIDIEIKDSDPLTAGDQKKTIKIPNIAEAIAEIYGLATANSANQEVELNMLLRLAGEVISIKNCVAITQDYARANADWMGYKGNAEPRTLTYNFNLAEVDLYKGNKPVELATILQTVEGSIRGWGMQDKDTLVDYLKKLMFAAGIVKASLFRNRKQVGDITSGVKQMEKDGEDKEQEWQDFKRSIKDPLSDYNKGQLDTPDLDIQFKDPNKL